jgi:hypothetical protein
LAGVLGALMFAPPSLFAQDEDELGAIAAQVRSAQFQAALEALDGFLARGDLAAARRNAALELRAIALLARRQEAEADRTLDELYARDPGYRLSDPGASPVVELAFVRAAARARPMEIGLAHDPPELAPGDTATLELRVTEGRDAVHEVRLAYRARDEAWARLVTDLDMDGTARVELPVQPSTTEAIPVRYSFEALAPSGAVLARLGTEDEPLALTIPLRPERVLVRERAGSQSAPAEQRGVVSSPWFWIAIVAVVAGGLVVGGYFLLGPPSQGPTIGDLGVVQLVPR